MKKLLTLVLALAMTLSLAACGGGGEDTADEGSEGSTSGEPTKMTLILRGGAYGESLEASLAPFEAEHNVDIEVMLMSFDDLHTGIALDAVNEVGTYDLCMVDGSWMAEFTENGVLANLSEMGYSFDDDIIPATTTICKVGEDIYLAPYYGNVTVMMYNKQLLADAGYAPEDIDSFADLMDIAQKTKAADSNKNGFLIRGGSADNILSDFLPHLVVHGGWVVDENNNPTVDTPEFKAAMQEYLDLYALGSTLDKDDIVASVTSGETALAQIWPGWYTPTADGPANYTTIPTKLTDDSAPVDAVALQGVWCIGIPDNAPHKDLALELLEYVMSPEVQLASIENNGVPCRYSCLTDSTVLETYPHLQTVCGALETGVYRPVIEEWTEFTNILGTEMDNIIQGTKTMDEALAFAAAAALRISSPELAAALSRNLTAMLPSFVFIMYSITVADKSCRAMFYNCDKDLLRYAWYRKPKVILRSFGIRLRRVALYNGLVAGALCLAAAGFCLISGTGIFTADLALFCAALLLLSLLFTAHHLCLYYIFQPYSESLKTKNPLFSGIHAAMYLLCFACLQIEVGGSFFTAVLLGFTVLYIAAALVLVYFRAPRSFRIK